LERKLTSQRELSLFAGREVLIHYVQNGKPQEQIGILLAGSDQGKISFSAKGETIELDMADVKQIRLYFDYDEDEE
jgi:ribosome maturation factor RimP